MKLYDMPYPWNDKPPLTKSLIVVEMGIDLQNLEDAINRMAELGYRIVSWQRDIDCNIVVIFEKNFITPLPTK